MKKGILIIVIFVLIAVSCIAGCTSQSASTVSTNDLKSMSLSELQSYEQKGLLPDNVSPLLNEKGECVKIKNKKLMDCSPSEEGAAIMNTLKYS